MKRMEWNFEYSGSLLAEAAQKKLDYHKERFAWWKQKREEVIQRIRSEGLEIDEKIILQLASVSPKSRDWERGSQINIRQDLQQNLTECLDKLSRHTSSISEYDGWVQLFGANPTAVVPLDYDDWRFFFGQFR